MIDVVAAQVRVAGGGLYFHHAFADFQDGDIKRSAAQVVHRDRFVFLLVQTVGQSRGRRFVDDAQHFQAGDFAGLLGGLPLAVVEICRYRDNRLGHFLAQEILRGVFSFCRIIAEISGGLYALPKISTRASSCGPRTTL